MSEDVSRRKMLSLLGLGAALGFTLSATLEPLEAEAQEAAARRRTRCHRDPRDATTFSSRAAHHSPSATAHTPYRSTRCPRCPSSDAIAIRAGV